jgi:tetraacyldisaccharide 4'-kinase
VRPDEPSWWYRAEPSAIAKALEPLGAAYGWAARQRYVRGQPYRARLPVICIGNFTAGGTGKTPLAIRLCRTLKARGHAPVALTRGYGGRLRGPHWVDAGRDRARDVGDEALLLACAVPTLLARDRPAGARAIADEGRAATVIVMDDGLQNPSLAKDLTIAVVDGARGIGNGRVMPAGPLRAHLDMQLELTDIVVVNETGAAGNDVSEWLRHRFPGPVLRARAAPAAAADWLRGARVIAWAGIGAPQRFFALLEELDADIVERVTFPDHHCPSVSEAEALIAASKQSGAMLVTTEKDMMRLSGQTGPVAALAMHSRPLPIELQFSAAEAERFCALVEAALAARAGSE